MCEPVELARRVIDVALLETTCRQNSAICSLSIMAKIRPPEKIEHINDMRALITPSSATVKMSSSLGSSSSCSYSSSLDSEDGGPSCPRDHDDLDDMINSIKNLQVYEEEDEPPRALKVVHFCSSSDDEDEDAKSEPTSDEDNESAPEEENDDDDELVERGPLRPQFHPRPRPYVEAGNNHHWQPPSENSTDYDTSAKAILTDNEYRQKIDFCLDRLSDMTQEAASGCDSLSPTHSDLASASGYSPPQQQPCYPDRSPLSCTSSKQGFVPSITVLDSESSLLEILSRGGFQPAQSLQTTPEYNHATASDHWPDSPASSSNACATSASRPDSRASSRAQSPGSNNGCSAGSFLNVLGSPMGSPHQQVVSPQAFRSLQRPSSSSSSSQSYCETPSPANYQSPLDQHSEEQLGDHMLNRLPAWRESFESTDTLVNSTVDSSELQLQLVEEVIRGDMSQPKTNELQVVPSCPPIQTTAPSTNYNNLNNNNNNSCMTPGSNNPAGTPDGNDDLTNTLLKFVGSDQAKLEARCSPATSGYSSSSSCGEVIKATCSDNYYLEKKNNFLDGPQRQPVYQQCMNLGTNNLENNLQHYSSMEHLQMSNRNWPSYQDPVLHHQQHHRNNNNNHNHFSNFQIPETVNSYNSHRPKSGMPNLTDESPNLPSSSSSKCKRTIAPWPSLNLPLTRASSRLKEMTDARDVDRAMRSLLKTPTERLTSVDKDGDTMLMCLTGNPNELQKKLAYLVPLVERMGTIDGALSQVNNRGEDALYLACMMCPRMAYVAGYLAATFLQKNIDIGRIYYRNKLGNKGDTLIHALAAKGDDHGEVLAELLSLKTAAGSSVFDLSRHNYDGRTPLHIAVEAHETLDRGCKIFTLGSARLLLEMGADPTVRDPKCGNTALHTAIALNSDPALIKILITVGRGHEAIHMANYNGDTPLHMAASMSERMNLDRQLETCWQLIHAGARTNVTNRRGKMPLALASPDRRESLRRLFHKKC